MSDPMSREEVEALRKRSADYAGEGAAGTRLADTALYLFNRVEQLERDILKWREWQDKGLVLQRMAREKRAAKPMSPAHAAAYHGDIDGDADPWIG